VVGLLKPDSGKVLIEGKEIHEKSGLDRYRLAIFLPQRTETYYIFRSIREEMRFALRHLSAEPEEIDELTRSYFAKAHLDCSLDANPGDLAMSQLSRLTLCVGVLARPRVLFIDEISSLSSNLCKGLLSDLLRQRRDSGLVTLVAVHRHGQLAKELLDGIIDL
jgi:phospholipid/cholesterol/gamma-HCH transport system ATP-binding protein